MSMCIIHMCIFCCGVVMAGIDTDVSRRTKLSIHVYVLDMCCAILFSALPTPLK